MPGRSHSTPFKCGMGFYSHTLNSPLSSPADDLAAIAGGITPRRSLNLLLTGTSLSYSIAAWRIWREASRATTAIPNMSGYIYGTAAFLSSVRWLTWAVRTGDWTLRTPAGAAPDRSSHCRFSAANQSRSGHRSLRQYRSCLATAG